MKNFLRLITLMLALNLGVAQANSNSSLKALIQDYQYQMTVEWDQQDAAFAIAAKEEFMASLEDLKANGITDKDLMVELQASIKNPAVISEMHLLKESFNAGSMSPDSFYSQVNDLIKKDQMQGTSWSGRSMVAWSVVIVLTTLWVLWTIDNCESEGCEYLPSK